MDVDPVQRWLPYRQPREQPIARLFCLAHSGAGASVFRDWAAALPRAEVCAVQYPGRETRFGEAPARRMAELVEPLFQQAVRHLLDRPYLVFGHSLGAVVAFELVRRIVRAGLARPAALILSGHGPRQRRQPLHLLPDEALRGRLCALGGTPREVLDSGELMALYLPVLRADLEVLETHRVVPIASLGCPIVGLAGTDDDLAPAAEVAAWRLITGDPFSLVEIAGDHFFIHVGRGQLLAHIQSLCDGALRAR
jgi:medium-chain acyl-[acyl-carrier-protein] hydrolase